MTLVAPLIMISETAARGQLKSLKRGSIRDTTKYVFFNVFLNFKSVITCKIKFGVGHIAYRFDRQTE